MNGDDSLRNSCKVSIKLRIYLLLSLLGHFYLSVSVCDYAHFDRLRGTFRARTSYFAVSVSLLTESINISHQVNSHVPASLYME